MKKSAFICFNESLMDNPYSEMTQNHHQQANNNGNMGGPRTNTTFNITITITNIRLRTTKITNRMIPTPR